MTNHGSKGPDVSEIIRWVTGAYRGSNTNRLHHLTGIDDLESQMHVKKIRWAASVYSSNILLLGTKAEGILKRKLGSEVDLQWMKAGVGRIGDVTVTDYLEGAEFSDGSRRDSHTAAATKTD